MDPTIESEDIWQTEKLKTVPNHIKEYTKTRIDLFIAKTVKEIATTTADIALGAALGFMGIIVLTFLSISAALAIGEALGKFYLGFLIVAGFYVLVSVIMFSMKQQLLVNPILSAIISKAYPNREK